ncbi:hypothetical protein [Truepera radiovictrix]|uniref:Uncharacterized protein n=1 Tax=Truepera radiovictrix (strain DSM 17093 / CIP 108686 / LMG 22925 / RQ-24) TaxID=649638 RepID=D7CTL8_TRURR|nr:hypothetical protein [Truepera radiovictrix]ADI13875.1 hypothetical protein Trad_0739 [Truepera radiovictrix DSM 17093]WMT57561.1 hypothetical protein RCV51_01130 [Truepera radiovictrix]
MEGDLIVAKLSVGELIEALAALDEEEQLELCDALVDDPRLRDLLETIDDYLYLEGDEEPPPNLHVERELN